VFSKACSASSDTRDRPSAVIFQMFTRLQMNACVHHTAEPRMNSNAAQCGSDMHCAGGRSLLEALSFKHATAAALFV
jgi:hypothetical protein